MGVMCNIDLDNPKSGVYRAGGTVTGVVRYAVDESTEYKDICISLVGTAHCKWTEELGNSFTTYIGDETLITQQIQVLDKKSNDSVTIPVGAYEFPFKFVLPVRLPSSYRDRHGTIEYFIKISFEKSSFFSLTKRFQKEIILYGDVESNLAEGQIIFGLEKKLFTLFSNNNRVTLRIEVPKTSFSPGENVQLKYQVTNDSNVEVTSVKTELIGLTQYQANCGRVKHYKKTFDICTVETPSILERSIAEMSNMVNIKPDLYSIQHSRIIVKDYRLRVTVRLPLPHLNDAVDIPIVVGEKQGAIEVAIEATEAFAMQEDTLSNEATALAEPPPTYWEAMTETKNDKS